MNVQKFILKSETDTIKLASKISRQVTQGFTLTLTGELGSGKTFLCRHIIKSLCGRDTKISSPTFNLLQTYQAQNFEIYHFDLFRINHLEEVYELGIEEALSYSVCLIEWPAIITNILPQDTISLSINILNDFTRVVKIFGAIIL